MYKEQTTRFIHSSYAQSIGGVLHMPMHHFLTDAPSASLPTSGGVIAHTKENISFNMASSEILRVGRASAKVSGEYLKDRNEYISLATATVEKLNILDVVTADRVVAKMTSVYPASEFEGRKYHPARFYVTGSHFDNLKIDGKPYDCRCDTPKAPPVQKPNVGDGPKLRLKEEFDKALRKLKEDFKDHVQDEPEEEFKDEFHAVCQGGFQKPFYVNQSESIHGCIFEKTYQVIPVEQFGKIHLGEISIYGGKVILNMLRVELGCPDDGSVDGPVACTNGRNTKP